MLTFLPTMIKVPNMTCKAPINNREKIGNGTSRRMTISKLFSKSKNLKNILSKMDKLKIK